MQLTEENLVGRSKYFTKLFCNCLTEFFFFFLSSKFKNWHFLFRAALKVISLSYLVAKVQLHTRVMVLHPEVLNIKNVNWGELVTGMSIK